jgi:hypothetical protein
MDARAKNPLFGLRGVTGDRIFTLLPDGTVYWFMNGNHYPGGNEERDRILRSLQDLRMADGPSTPARCPPGEIFPAG